MRHIFQFSGKAKQLGSPSFTIQFIYHLFQNTGERQSQGWRSEHLCLVGLSVMCWMKCMQAHAIRTCRSIAFILSKTGLFYIHSVVVNYIQCGSSQVHLYQWQAEQTEKWTVTETKRKNCFSTIHYPFDGGFSCAVNEQQNGAGSNCDTHSITQIYVCTEHNTGNIERQAKQSSYNQLLKRSIWQLRATQKHQPFMSGWDNALSRNSGLYVLFYWKDGK